MSQPVTVALRAYVAVETAISVATMMLPKKSPNTGTDNGVASTTAPARRWVAWEIASRRKSSLIRSSPRFDLEEQRRSLIDRLRYGKRIERGLARARAARARAA